MRRLILRNFQSLGDVIMLTAAVRDLHRSYPEQFVTDVRTCFPELWVLNPCLSPLREEDPDVTVIDCRYPLVEFANTRPYHFLHGFMHFLNRELRLAIRPTEFRGDLYLSAEERARPPFGLEPGYWLVNAGGKYDYTVKWWDHARYQQTVNALSGQVQFVQVGDLAHHHPRLEGAIDLRGRTGVRDLMALTCFADGVLCGVTSLMHLAAAVPGPSGMASPRPCVVVAGGREPPHWEAYPTHQYIHTVGMLPCCAEGGCWRSRTAPLGDGTEHDREDRLCLNVTSGNLPRCMDLISSESVISRIQGYYDGGRIAPAKSVQCNRVN